MTKMLTAKLMKVKLKQGWTISNFATYLGCSEEEVPPIVFKAFSKNAANDMLSDMRANQKKSKKRTTKSGPSQLETSEQPVQSAHIPEEKEETCETMQNLNIPISPTTELEKLKKIASEESNNLCNLEVSRNELSANKRAINRSLENERDHMLQLRSLIQERQATVESLIFDLNEVNEKISQINEKISASRQNLENLNREIKELQKVTLYVYDNNSIECENLQIEIPEFWQEIYDNLRTNTLVEDITLRQAKQLSKVLALVKSLQERDLSFEVTFENEYLEEIFNEINS